MTTVKCWFSQLDCLSCDGLSVTTAAVIHLLSVQFDCCGVSGPEDFEESLFRLLSPTKLVPEACCQRNLGEVGTEQCMRGSIAFRHNKVSKVNAHRVCQTCMSFHSTLIILSYIHLVHELIHNVFIFGSDLCTCKKHFKPDQSTYLLIMMEINKLKNPENNYKEISKKLVLPLMWMMTGFRELNN